MRTIKELLSDAAHWLNTSPASNSDRFAVDELTKELSDAATQVGIAALQAAAPNPSRLDLYDLHVRLLPLAQAAGHEQLLLSEHIGQLDGTTPYYEASCTGGRSGFRRYIDYFGYGSAPGQFERALTEKLAEQKAYLLNHLSHAA